MFLEKGWTKKTQLGRQCHPHPQRLILALAGQRMVSVNFHLNQSIKLKEAGQALHSMKNLCVSQSIWRLSMRFGIYHMIWYDIGRSYCDTRSTLFQHGHSAGKSLEDHGKIIETNPLEPLEPPAAISGCFRRPSWRAVFMGWSVILPIHDFTMTSRGF